MTKVWASVAEQNPNQAAGPFGGTKEVALMKTIEYKQGAAMPGGSGESVTWAGTHERMIIRRKIATSCDLGEINECPNG